MISELSPAQVRARCDPGRFSFQSTAELKPAATIIGQPRATAALRFGLGMPDGSYHVVAAGPPGTGKMTAVGTFLAEAARSRPAPADTAYVYNFANPDAPLALRLPAGQGRRLADDVQRVVKVVRDRLPQAFEAEGYTGQRDLLVKALEQEREERLNELQQEARAQDFALQSTPMGLALVPLHHGQPMSDADFAALSPADRDRLQQRRQGLEDQVEALLKSLRERERGVREDLEKLDRDVALQVVGGLFKDLLEDYAAVAAVEPYLVALRDDIIARGDLFRQRPDDDNQAAMTLAVQRDQALRRYQVNVVVARDPTAGAPVVTVSHPTYQNLIGRVEKEAQFGALVTDHTLIRGGALHQANGGYLVVNVNDLLTQPFAWDSLKRALANRQIVIEDPSDWLGGMAVRSLRPVPVALDVKVVLVGESQIFAALRAVDPEFAELFRVRADFDSSMARTAENEDALVAFVARNCQEEGLRPFDRTGVARVIEHASRLAEDQRRLALQFSALSDLVREASYWAGAAGSATVTGEHVRQAVAQQIYRASLVEDRLDELVQRGVLLVDVTGAQVGQVNGLAVESTGDHSFGRPSRITAVVGVGREGVIDVEREVELGGKLHSKGVMILAGFLTDRFAQQFPLALHARLTFEQSYGEVDGDSASSTELYALLSRLSDVPIKQNLAVTGSVNQRGEIQAIGGVNEKIEGFFQTCKVKGMTGDQGVVIPVSNAADLMLDDEVVEAIAAEKFHVYAVGTVEEGIEALTGVPAGQHDAEGHFPPDTVYARVTERLAAMVQALRNAGAPPTAGPPA
jgi:lon-related putative ATP-dependent protease